MCFTSMPRFEVYSTMTHLHDINKVCFNLSAYTIHEKQGYPDVRSWILVDSHTSDIFLDRWYTPALDSI